MEEKVVVKPQPISSDVQALIDSGKVKLTFWDGLNNYDCAQCQFASLYEDKILKHIKMNKHPWTFPKPVTEDPEERRAIY